MTLLGCTHKIRGAEFKTRMFSETFFWDIAEIKWLCSACARRYVKRLGAGTSAEEYQTLLSSTIYLLQRLH